MVLVGRTVKKNILFFGFADGSLISLFNVMAFFSA